MAAPVGVVEVRKLYTRFRQLDADAQSGVMRVVTRYTDELEADLRRRLGVMAASQGRRPQRSRPGQAPRQDTGRLIGSLRKKVLRKMTRSKNGVGYVPIGQISFDAERRGARYPFMLESGSLRVKARPSIKPARRALQRPFRRAVALAMVDALRRNP